MSNLSTAEFKERIAKLLGVEPGSGKRSTNRDLVRKPTDRGYYPPTKPKGKR